MTHKGNSDLSCYLSCPKQKDMAQVIYLGLLCRLLLLRCCLYLVVGVDIMQNVKQ